MSGFLLRLMFRTKCMDNISILVSKQNEVMGADQLKSLFVPIF
jgi:hypothetical protein